MHRLFVPHLTCKGTLVSTLPYVLRRGFVIPHSCVCTSFHPATRGCTRQWRSFTVMFKTKAAFIGNHCCRTFCFHHKTWNLYFCFFNFHQFVQHFQKSSIDLCVCVRANMWTHTYCKSNFLLFIRQNVLSCGMNYSNHWSRNKQRQLVLR